MDIFEYTHLDQDLMEALFEEMSNILLNDLLSHDNIQTLAFCNLYEAGFDVKNYDSVYDKSQMLNFLNLEITMNDLNMEKLIDNLFFYSCIDSGEYEMLKKEFVEQIENQASLMVYIKQINNVIKECIITYTDVTIEYILEVSIQQLIQQLNSKINTLITYEHKKLSSEYIYVFREFSLSYDIDLLCENIKQKGEGI